MTGMTDDDLMHAFASGSLTAEAFGHRQHVRLAWLHVTRLPLLEAIRQQTSGLRRLTQRLGVPSRYHETITVAYVWFEEGGGEPGDQDVGICFIHE